MALKDWKKTKSFNKEVFHWKNNKGETLELAEFKDSWFLWKPNDRPSIPIKDKMKSKSQAIKYAKQYMRTH